MEMYYERTGGRTLWFAWVRGHLEHESPVMGVLSNSVGYIAEREEAFAGEGAQDARETERIASRDAEADAPRRFCECSTGWSKGDPRE